ncbi:MAG: glycosyltransferase [Rhodovibrionaceae bacterium]
MTQTPGSARRIALLLKGYPRLSETFIAQEILALERRGFAIEIVSLRRPYDPDIHPIHREIQAPVAYLPEYLHQEPLRVLRGLAASLRLPGFARAVRAFLRDLRRDFTVNRLRRFGQAAVLARELPRDIAQLYVHFLHTPASVARYTALLRGLPWAASAHARDIWTIPEWEKREKLAELDWLATCTLSGAEHLRSLSGDPAKILLIYHGLDFSRLPDAPRRVSLRDGSDPGDPLRLISVGRAVEKKGYDDLLHALAALPPELHWRLTHIGGGELGKELKALAARLGLAERIDWLGAQSQAEVFTRYAEADLFVLASKIAADGDRDGLPNVLMEAQSQGLPCLSTAVSAIPELIEDGVTGRLVPPGDRQALAAALAELSRDPALRKRLGTAGCRRVRADFAMEAGIERLAARLGEGAPR